MGVEGEVKFLNVCLFVSFFGLGKKKLVNK